jgi:superkiller protein 3
MVASLVNRAILRYGEGRAEQAVELLLEARRVDPGAVSVLQNLGLIERNRGNMDRAAGYLEEALRLEPADPVLLGMLIQVRKDQDRRGDLVELYRRLVAAQPQNAQAFAELGELLEEQGDLPAAERAFLKAESLATEEPYPYLYLARLSIRRGGESRRILSRLHSAVGKAVQKSGMLQMQAAGTIRKTEGAPSAEEVEELERLARAAERPRRILREALALLAETHDSTEAYARDLERLSDWYPHSLELLVAEGRVLEELGRFGEAREHWLAVLEDMPTAAEAHLGLGRCLEQLGSLQEARTAFRRARDLEPENPEVYAHLLGLYTAAGEEQALLHLYEELYSRERVNVPLLDAWAELEDRLGNPQGAAEHRLRARALEQREEQKQGGAAPR